jgi:DeoR/GlpR family transcriptional regulator of sugar metabolism
MTVVTRRALVRQLVENDPTLSQRAIAAQLGVSKDTVRRDLEEMSRAQNPTQSNPGAAEPATAPQGYLLLQLDEPLRHALAVLRRTVDAPDTTEQNVAAARAAIHSVADTILEQQHHLKGVTR